MSQIAPEDHVVQNHEIQTTGQNRLTRCRIPQRLGSGRTRVVAVAKLGNFQKPPPVPVGRSIRPRSTESRAPRTPNRTSYETAPKPTAGYTVRSDKTVTIARKPPTLKNAYRTHGKNTSVIPVAQRLQKIQKMPDQETIKQREEKELLEEYTIAKNNGGSDCNTDLKHMKNNWDDNLDRFRNMKIDLDRRQQSLMELYATLRNTHKMMVALGQPVNLPSAEDLRIMNVAKLSPDQLLQLCAGSKRSEELLTNGPVTVDMNKLYDMPTKLVATCEQTLIKRKEIIDWFQTLKTEEKGISLSKLTKKINEFNMENDMLNCSLQTCKTEFLKQLNEIVDFLRKGVNETIALQLRTEDLLYELSEVQSENVDLRKQIQSNQYMKLQNNRQKVEDLEKELKEEKCKKIVFKDRLTRAEGQVKMGNSRAEQLEASLEQARSQNWTLERTVQKLNEQNQKLQVEFEKELNKLTESIKENTVHLEQIAKAREKLQNEKELLEQHLKEITDNNNEVLENLKAELNTNINNLLKTEKHFEEEKDERKKLESKLEHLCAQLFEAEIRYKDALKQMQEKDETINKLSGLKTELNSTKEKLESTRSELSECKTRLMNQNETIREIELNFKEQIGLERNLKCDLRTKENYITELENKQCLLEKKLLDSEQKLETYESQFSSLKINLSEVQEEFGEFDNINELRNVINQQRKKLLETTEQNSELAKVMQQKDLELEGRLELIAGQEALVEQKTAIIKRLTEKDEEQANIIKLLRNNLEMRAQADSDLTQQLAEKNLELESLVTNVDTRKKQINQLEKIILTLEEQLRKVNLQKRRDQDKIAMLEKALIEYESFPVDTKHSMDVPADNLDNLIKILEDELGTSFEPKYEVNNKSGKRKYIAERKMADKLDYPMEGINDVPQYLFEDKQTPRSLAPKTVKKNNLSERDTLDRKKAITSIDTQKWLPNCEPLHVYNISPVKDNNMQSYRGIGLLPAVPQHLNNQREEKKCKMFKFAGHRL